MLPYRSSHFQPSWWFSLDTNECNCMIILLTMLGLLSRLIFLLGSVQSSQYVTISRSSYPSCSLVTLQPPLGQIRTTKTPIREIIYVPSHVNVQPEELEENDYLHDDHFCSLLCDQGFVVHVLQLNSLNKGRTSLIIKPLMFVEYFFYSYRYGAATHPSLPTINPPPNTILVATLLLPLTFILMIRSEP